MDSRFYKICEFIRGIYNQPEGRIPLHNPIFKGNEKKYLNECIDSTFVSSVGKFVDKFEDKIAEYTGTVKAVACVNGTTALYLALKLVGVSEGSEVITQALTFVATANSISHCSAIPVFLDVDMDTMGLSPSALQRFLETQTYSDAKTNQRLNKTTHRRISACIPMHTFGHPCRIDEIIDICNYYNIPVIEDAAESLGSFYKNKHTGTFGDIGILSFNGNKIMTTGGGGMLLFQDENLAKHAKHLTTQAKLPHKWEFVHNEVGYNYRMPNINAALGVAQLEQLEYFLASKRELATRYERFFSTIDITFINETQNASSNYWLNCILLQDRDERNALLQYTNDKGVVLRPAWKLLNELMMFRNCQTDTLKNAIVLADKIINIPSSTL